MLVKVLRAFPYSPDGCRTFMVEPGVFPIREDLIEGLQAEGYIDEATAEDVAASQEPPVLVVLPPEIPEGWADLHWFQLRALAQKINGAPVKDKATAVAVITTEIARQAAL